MELALIFPHQLYPQSPAVRPGCTVVLVEDELYFSQYAFHKQKLVLHRASMKVYQQMLLRQGYTTHYIEAQQAQLSLLFKAWRQQGISEVRYVDTTDYLLERRLNRFAAQTGIKLQRVASPNFLTPTDQFEQLFPKGKKYLMADFYIRQRKRLNILVENNSPVGGQWSFDADNRKRLPKDLPLPTVFQPSANPWVAEATHYVQKHFSKNPGASNPFYYPVTFNDAEKVVDDFLLNRMRHFGEYEDAIAKNESILFHSVLTPALNIGLLSPQQILDRTLEVHRTEKFPLNSLEGFVRQVIGWREFMRAVYLREGVQQRTANFWNYTRKIPASFYIGTTGIEPVDQTIKKVLQTGYCHHIERLMILGNFMHLCGFNPEAVYRWFMELFIDAYDWVMVPNVYGMSQYADGGLMTTKPYVSGSNYVVKMSDYTKGPWCEVWDALYWNYIARHHELFARNPRMGMVVNLLKKMERGKLVAHRNTAEQFLAGLNTGH
ncbi:MAG: cryptochrome/photolyase family protein [Cyclobacteriaceae bacterium]|nr:cryptochrome/photolyase family protein [Cyclobacteriaceae bacterium]